MTCRESVLQICCQTSVMSSWRWRHTLPTEYTDLRRLADWSSSLETDHPVPFVPRQLLAVALCWSLVTRSQRLSIKSVISLIQVENAVWAVFFSRHQTTTTILWFPGLCLHLKKCMNMKWRVPGQEVDLRKLGKRLWRKTARDVNLTERMPWIIIDGGSR